MKRFGRYWKWGILLLLIPAADYGYRRWSWWNNFEQIVVWDRWKVDLPKGGNVTYINQSPRMRLIGPADTEKLLIWQKPDGRAQRYQIAFGGGGYRDLEFRSGQDGDGIWLISHDRKGIVATIDVKGGKVIMGDGVSYDRNGELNEDVQGILPSWAKSDSGHSLGRKKF